MAKDKFTRKEFKYFVPIGYIEDLRQRVLGYAEYDPNCVDKTNHLYQVRSIYFDTIHYLFFYEKIEGVKIRKKLRIRTYDQKEPNSIAFFEIKRKFNNEIYKERAKVRLDEVPELLNGDILTEKTFESFQQKSAFNKFIYLMKRLNLVPRVLVTYEREAFAVQDDSSTRLTFDLNTRSYPDPELEDIFREADLKSFTDPYFILEIKFFGRMPYWARQIVRDFHLHQEAISKYCKGLETWFPNLQ